jgi:hypothetical protein
MIGAPGGGVFVFSTHKAAAAGGPAGVAMILSKLGWQDFKGRIWRANDEQW